MLRRVRYPVVLCACLALFGCERPRPLGLLAGRAPSEVRSVADAERLTDGTVPMVGDAWDSTLTAVFERPHARVTWDLGAEQPIDAVVLSGDNNDSFFVEGSLDGERYQPLFTAGAVPGSGMHLRQGSGLGKRARYVRIRARGGDRSVSVGELLVLSTTPSPFPPRLHFARGLGSDQRPWAPLLGMLALLSAFVALSDRRIPRGVRRASWALFAGGLGCFAWTLHAYYPLHIREHGILRMILAGAALACIARLWPGRRNVVSGPVDVTLWVVAVLALATFHNLGQPQFPDVKHGGKTHVHTYDMRVYYPVAKYFESLRFDGLYFASIAAYEDGTGRSERSTDGVSLRDLRTNQIVKAREVREEIRAVRKRFSPARWQAFQRDMRYFWETMGPGGYLGSLRDHGGNATPFWLTVARGLFSGTTASYGVLLLAGLLDPLLILGLCVAIARSFGTRTMLLCAIVFGTTDFPQFTSNWVGATLRNDWMVYLGLGLCALRVGRHGLGGVLLAASAMARAFPALAVFFLPVPALLWWIGRARSGQPAGLRVFLDAQRPLWRAAAGATATVIVLFCISGAVLGFERGWGGWLDKITMHAEKPNINHVGLRTLFAYDPALTAGHSPQWTRTQRETLQRRAPLYHGAMVAFGLLAGLAAIGRSLQQAALLGMMFIPILLYPANYYMHCVFLLPMLADSKRGHAEGPAFYWNAAVLLGMSFAQYFSYRLGWTDLRFTESSVVLIVGWLLLLVPMAVTGWRRRATMAA